MNLEDENSIKEAVKGIDYIVHMAHPVPNGIDHLNEEDYLRPAERGTATLIKSAINEGVKRVVLTSSSSTIVGDYFKYPELNYTEDDFAPDAINLYEKSKII